MNLREARHKCSTFTTLRELTDRKDGAGGRAQKACVPQRRCTPPGHGGGNGSGCATTQDKNNLLKKITFNPWIRFPTTCTCWTWRHKFSNLPNECEGLSISIRVSDSVDDRLGNIHHLRKEMESSVQFSSVQFSSVQLLITNSIKMMPPNWTVS